MIMDNISRMNAFLELIKNAALAGRKIDNSLVYGTLTRFGRRVVNNEKISGNFDDFRNFFSEVDNIDVFVDKEDSYFCHFQNERSRFDFLEMLKMYVPIDDEHINEAAKRIFSFMAANNLKHSSKVASVVRIDDLVIRVPDKKTLNMVRDFIRNDDYIREGLMNVNPFLPNDGMFSYAWDGYLSYNDTLANYIVMYINGLKRYNMLDSVSFRDFYIFIANTYKDVFENGRGIPEFLRSMDKEPEVCTGRDLATYEGVTKMLLLTLDPKSKGYDTFIRAYDEVSTLDRFEDCDLKMQESITKSMMIYDSAKNLNKETINKELNKYVPLWVKVYPAMVRKYGFEVADERFLRFFETANCDYLTRDENVRTLIDNSRISPEIFKLLFIKMKKKQANALMLASLETFYKYNYQQLYEALYDGEKGSFDKFTSQNGVRKLVSDSINPGELRGILISTLLDRDYDISSLPHEFDKLINLYIESITDEKVYTRKG